MISVIVAIARGGVIGGGNRLLWHISEDLQRFKAITSGHPVVMGRKTFESLGRPLPNRTNVVVSRNEDYAPQGVTVVGSFEEAVAMFEQDEEVFVIGGAQIYAQGMEVADRFYVTWVDNDYQGDTFFPEWNREQWEVVGQEHYERGKDFPYPFRYVDYVRKK